MLEARVLTGFAGFLADPQGRECAERRGIGTIVPPFLPGRILPLLLQISRSGRASRKARCNRGTSPVPTGQTRSARDAPPSWAEPATRVRTAGSRAFAARSSQSQFLGDAFDLGETRPCGFLRRDRAEVSHGGQHDALAKALGSRGRFRGQKFFGRGLYVYVNVRYMPSRRVGKPPAWEGRPRHEA